MKKLIRFVLFWGLFPIFLVWELVLLVLIVMVSVMDWLFIDEWGIWECFNRFWQKRPTILKNFRWGVLK